MLVHQAEKVSETCAASGQPMPSPVAKLALPLCTHRVAERNKGKQLVVHSGGGGPAPPGGITPAAKAALAGTVMVPTAGGGQVRWAFALPCRPLSFSAASALCALKHALLPPILGDENGD